MIRDPVIQSYLEWRARIAVADRMADLGSSARTRMERDPVLSEAVRLLQASSDQAELFAMASREHVTGTRGEAPSH